MKTVLTKRQVEIIQSAGKIMTAKGLSGLTIKNLANQMEFSESAIYRHFKSKEEIIITMLEYLADLMNSSFEKINNSNIEIEEKFKNIFRGQFEFFSDYPYYVSAIFPDALIDESHKINETIFKVMQTKIRHLMPVIEKGQQDGVFVDKVSSDQLIHITMGSFRLLMFKWRINKFQSNIIEEGEKMIVSLLLIIKNEKK
jgi:TetR/AcrR family fatty acid metabolism transcriptional regulator